MRPFILLSAVVLLSSCTFWGKAVNPDPNHTHADFAVWIDGKKLDFSDAKFMSGVSTDDASHDDEGEYLHKHLHLHDGNGDVIHRHKPGLTLRDFFESVGTKFRVTSGGLCIDFPQIKEVCQQEALHKNDWVMIVNGKQGHFDPAYVFADEDQILISNASDAGELQKEWTALTSDACLYSQTCPERGKPPVENCIADPEVPCTAP